MSGKSNLRLWLYRLVVLLLIALYFGALLYVLYFFTILGDKYLVKPLVGTWSGIGEMPWQIWAFMGTIFFLIFTAIFYTYKMYRFLRCLFWE